MKEKEKSNKPSQGRYKILMVPAKAGGGNFLKLTF